MKPMPTAAAPPHPTQLAGWVPCWSWWPTTPTVSSTVVVNCSGTASMAGMETSRARLFQKANSSRAPAAPHAPAWRSIQAMRRSVPSIARR